MPSWVSEVRSSTAWPERSRAVTWSRSGRAAALIARLVAVSASGAPWESRRTIASNCSAHSSSEKTWVTNPAASASFAESRSEVRASRMAVARPTAAATVAVARPSGINPIRENPRVSAADSRATIRSPAMASESPTPAATPLSPMTTGVAQSSRVRTMRAAASAESPSYFSAGRSPDRSAPAEKASPLPVITTTRTASSDCAARNCSMTPSTISPSRALKASGLSRVNQRAESRRVTTRLMRRRTSS